MKTTNYSSSPASLAYRQVTLLAGLCLSLGSFAFAQPAAELKRADRTFIEKAGKSGMEEVALSQIAVERASNADVKAFAQMLVSDHTGANSTLTQIAASKGVTLPASEPVPSKWSKKTGKDFDEDYIDRMVSDHESAVKLFSKESSDGKDTETMAFASKTLPALQAHLDRAKELKKMLK